MTQPQRPERTEKTERQRDQRRVSQARQQRAELRRRAEQPDVLPLREDDGQYRP